MGSRKNWAARLLLVALLIALLGATGVAGARAAQDKIDTEHLFGFLTGTDTGEVGERELESTTVGRFGKRTGSYQAGSQTLALEYTPAENLRLELGATGAYHRISGVTGLDDLRRASFQGLSLEVRYRLLARAVSGIGVAILVEPRWARIDDVSGRPVGQYGADLAILIDKELIPDRIVAAFNVFYAPEVTQSRLTGAWERDATLGVGTAIMAKIAPGVFMGGEARYLRSYESLGFGGYSGHAVFAGPNLFFKPAEGWRVTVSWAVQVAGRAVDEPGPFDLANFERHQLRLRIGREF